METYLADVFSPKFVTARHTTNKTENTKMLWKWKIVTDDFFLGTNARVSWLLKPAHAAVCMNPAAEAYELFINQDRSASVWVYLHTNKQIMNY